TKMWRTCVLPAFLDCAAAGAGDSVSAAIAATDGSSVLIETSGAMCGQVYDVRSRTGSLAAAIGDAQRDALAGDRDVDRFGVGRRRLDVEGIPAGHVTVRAREGLRQPFHLRSEEHTSELLS